MTTVIKTESLTIQFGGLVAVNNVVCSPSPLMPFSLKGLIPVHSIDSSAFSSPTDKGKAPLLRSEPLDAYSRQSSLTGKISKASPKKSRLPASKSCKYKKACIKALLTALEELGSEESDIEAEEVGDLQTLPHSSSPSLVRRSDSHQQSPKKPTSGTSKNHAPLSPSFLKLRHGLSVFTSCPSSLSNPKDSCSSGSGDMYPQDWIVDCILRWNIYKEFLDFYSNIGIMLNSIPDAKLFFDDV